MSQALPAVDSAPGVVRGGPAGETRHRRARLPRFAAVGLSGLIVNQALLVGLVEGTGLHYLAAALAGSLGSTLWNFALTECWVFPGAGRASRWQRLARFCGMNTASFAVQAPLLIALTGELRVPYALSNAVALAALASARYLICEQVIWRGPTLSVVPRARTSGNTP